MFWIAGTGLLIGAVIGAVFARAKGGKTLDLLQYAASFGMMGMIIGVFAAIVLHRILLG